MRFPLRAIIFGILTGAFLFFFPFHFFFFPVLFFLLAVRIFFRPWRWRHYYNGYGPHRFGSYRDFRYAGHGPMQDDFIPVTPIDGFRSQQRSRKNPAGDRNINIQ